MLRSGCACSFTPYYIEQQHSGYALLWVTSFYKTAICSIWGQRKTEGKLLHVLFVQVNKHHLSSTNYEAQTDKWLSYARITTYEPSKLNQEHMDMWVYQTVSEKIDP
jgi:hypothetical protein